MTPEQAAAEIAAARVQEAKTNRDARVRVLEIIKEHKETFGVVPLAEAMGLTRYRIYQYLTELKNLTDDSVE